MFCNRCGTALQPQQTTCPACGQLQPVVALGESRLTTHLHLLAIFWFIVAALTAIGAFVMLAIGGFASAAMHMGNAPPIARILGPAVFWGIGSFIGILAALSFVTGYGLLKARPWGRILALVLGFISLLHPPFGTALGVYTLVVLLPADAAAEYQRISLATA